MTTSQLQVALAPTGTAPSPTVTTYNHGLHAMIEFPVDGPLNGLVVTLGAHDAPVAWLRQFASRLTLVANDIEAARDNRQVVTP